MSARGFKFDVVNGILGIFSNGVRKFLLGNDWVGERALTRVDVNAQNATMPVSTIKSGLLVHTSVTGAGTLTVSTGALLDTGFPGLAVGETVSCLYVNDGTQTVTLTGDTGTTAVAATTIATLQGAEIVFMKTGTATYDVYAL